MSSALNLEDDRYDDMFLQIVQQIGKGPQGLLGAALGFLKRRTDFFYEAEPGDKMGFPPGYAESMVSSESYDQIYQIFKYFQTKHYEKYPHMEGLEKRWEEHQKKMMAKAKAEKEGKPVPEDLEEDKEAPKEEEVKTAPAQVKRQVLPEPTIDPAPLRVMKPQKIPEPEKTEPAAPKPLDPELSKISTYNGDSTEKYNWSQGHSDLTVQIPLPEGVTAKNLNVKLTNTKVLVEVKTTGQVLLEGKFDDRIKVEESLWCVEDDHWLRLDLEKQNEVIWKTILRGDREIDPKKVDNAKKLEEFDVETQGQLQKVLYEQNRRFNGKPTTEEEESLNAFERIFHSEHSPWKGQPYDPRHMSMSGRPTKAPLAH